MDVTDSMITKLTRHGDDWALVIDKPVLDQLQIDQETPLEVTTDGQSLIVTRAADAARQARLESAIQKANERFGGALKRLAE
ncbi:MAG TPA: hypothetical protein VFW87_26800 [Pirellulales bacterium]|nr:hypothetical protein [Pirellulales bacterium]